MKKYKGVTLVLLGFALGMSISYAPQIEAATSKLLGSKVGNVLQVKIDNKTIGEGAVINGTTYVPLRVTANEMGLEVKKVDSKEVVLSSPEGGEVPVNDIPSTQGDEELVRELNAKISELNKKVRESKDVLTNKEQNLRAIKAYRDTAEIIKKALDQGTDHYTIDDYNKNIESAEKMQKLLTDAETNLPLYEKQLEDLKEQLAELQK
jgi:hypothetical protein